MQTTTNLLMPAALLASALTSLAVPSISVQPADQTANQGFSATLKVTATTAAPPLSYQWFFASNAIPSAITNALTITNAQPTNAGGYFVVVTDSDGSVTSRTAALTVMLPAVLDPKLSANIRLGEDSPLLTNRPAQAEPHLARSFTDPNRLLAAFQDGIGATDEPWACSYAVSTNAGLTWTRALIPGLTTVSGGTNGIAGDNVAAFDAQGNAYIASLAGPVPLSDASEMLTSKSVDGGQSFAAPRRSLTGIPSDWPDKDWLAVNTFAGSPTANRIAVAYTEVEPTQSTKSFSLYSDDGGVTWSAPKLVSSLTYGVQNFFLPDGSLVVLNWKFVGGAYSTGAQRIEMVRSPDGGAAFDAPVAVMDTSGSGNPDTLVSTPRFLPSASCDRQAGVIYVACGALIGSGTNRAARILFTKSIDQGKTWSAPVQVNKTPSRKSVFNPALAVSPDGQHVTIAFYDKRNDPGQGYFVDLYLAESFDGGDTWGPNLRLSEFSSDIRKAPRDQFGYFLGEYQGTAPSLNFQTPAVAVWIDTRAGNNDPYVVRIQRTKGTTFETWRKLRFTTNDLANLAVSGESADPDGDGIPNLAEYAFGLEPTRPDPSPLKITKAANGVSLTVTISYERLGVLSDIAFSWEASVNLVEWTPVNPAQEEVRPGRDVSIQRVESSFTAAEQMRFFRLRVNRAAPTP